MPDYVERLTLRILGVDMDDVLVGLTETTDVPTKTVPTMNKKKEDRGFRSGNSKHTLEADAEQISDPAVPDWDTLMDQRTPITIVKTPDIGVPTTYTNARVTRVVKNTTDGDGSVKVSILALSRKIG